MEASDKRLLANQRNAKAGGVKTANGKAISSKNALTHGLLAQSVSYYDQAEVVEIYQALANEFDDSLPSSKMLIEQLSLTQLKLVRCNRIEKEYLNEMLNPPVYDGIGELGFNSIREVNDKSTIDVTSLDKLELILIRYEPALVNRMIKLITLLTEKCLGSFGKKERGNESAK